MKRNRRLIFGISVAAALIIAIKVLLSIIYVPPILMYHSLDENEDTTKLSLCPTGFERQMAFFYKHRYNVVPLEEMIRMIRSGQRVPHKTVAITFDDGYKNNFECAFPVLKRYGFPATIFVVTGFIGRDGYMDWADMKILEDNGISIGSHTRSHLWLPGMSDERLRDEISGSKSILEAGLGKEVEVLSYPIGAYDDRVKAFVKEAGYEAACATNPGPNQRWDDLFSLKRVRISRTSNNLFVFWLETSGYYTFIKETRDEE